LSTVRAADRIIVLQNGGIIEEGDHEALMIRGGHYADLYNTYFRHQSADYQPRGAEGYIEARRSRSRRVVRPVTQAHIFDIWITPVQRGC